MTANPVTKFQILAAQIESQHDQWGMESVMSSPEPLYFILGILDEAAKDPNATASDLIEDLFEQMNTNFGPAGFDFDAFHERMAKERADREAAKTAPQRD